MPTVFISYSHKDKDWVRNYLLANLEKNGIPCHIDFRDFEIGKASIICMEEAVESCAKSILVYSQNWVESEFSQFEGVMLQTDSPLNLNKKLVPIKLETCNIPKRLNILNYADFSDKVEQDNQLQRVIRQIKSDFVRMESETKAYPPLDKNNVDITRLPQTRYELYGRDKELTLLNETWESGKLNIISFVAYGGVGKSSLVKKWVEKLQRDNYRGAEKVFAWSFYSQGTGERVTSADMFINEALKWFGDKNPEQGSAWDKGKRLAGFINKHKTLLILDGLEPLQSDEKVEKGKIKYAALQTLVKELAKYNKGLCIITTRKHVPELDRYPKTAIQSNLEHISDEAGRKILETRRIRGTEDELEKIVRQFGNHALAVNLLAEYLHLFKGHPVVEAQNIPDLNIPEDKGKHARRIIEAFGKYFGTNAPECQLLSILGLFDRPIPVQAIQAVLNKIPIQNLTDELADTKGESLITTLKNLRKYKLIFVESEHRPNTLDCHPLIREHFGEKLETENPAAWKEAHARLYEYYKNLPEKELPDTLEEMEPLFAAVRHGCLAGKHQETLLDVFIRRIIWFEEDNSVFCIDALYALLSCVSNFFERLWDRPASGLTDYYKAYVLLSAGNTLHKMGMLLDASHPIKAGLEMLVTKKDWKNAASFASRLSELYLTIGQVANAVAYGRQGAEFADKSGDGFYKESKRTTHADALHQAGNVVEAEKLFHEAELMQHKTKPEIPYLYSFRGFQYCDLLLSMGKYEEVLERAKMSFEWVKRQNWFLDIALDKLNIGKALMFLKDVKKAENYLKQAIDGLRQTDQQQFLPLGLLVCATYCRLLKDFLTSWADLDETLEIAEYGQMGLHLTDYHLEAARLILAQISDEIPASSNYQIIENGETLVLTRTEMQAKLREHFLKAETLIQETGYHLRDKELEELRNFV